MIAFASRSCEPSLTLTHRNQPRPQGLLPKSNERSRKLRVCNILDTLQSKTISSPERLLLFVVKIRLGGRD